MAKDTTTQTRTARPRPGVAKQVKPADPPVEPYDAEPVVSHGEIARLAYSYWEARGGESGSAEEDWLRAEGALKARRAAAK